MKNLDLDVLRKIHQRLNQNKEKVSHIGTVLKQRRKELKLKQFTVAHGICSISHLSKIENNQTVPDPQIVNLLIQRLKLKSIDLYHTQNYGFLDEMLTSYFYDDPISMERLLSENISKTTVASQLITHYHHAMVQKDVTTTSEISSELDEIYRTFSAEEFIVWIIGLMSEAFMKHDYKFLIRLSYVLDEEAISKRSQRALFHRLLFQAYLHLGHAPLAFVHARELENEMQFMPHQKTQEMLQLSMRYFLLDHCPYSVERYLIKDDYMQYLPEHDNLRALIQCELAIKLDYPFPSVMPNPDFKDIWYFRLLLCLSEHTDYDPSEEFADQHLENAAFRSLFLLSQLKDAKRRYRFIKEEALSMLMKHQEGLYLRRLTDEIYRFLIQTSRYKEAIAVMKNTEKVLSIPLRP